MGNNVELPLAFHRSTQTFNSQLQNCTSSVDPTTKRRLLTRAKYRSQGQGLRGFKNSLNFVCARLSVSDPVPELPLNSLSTDDHPLTQSRSSSHARIFHTFAAGALHTSGASVRSRGPNFQSRVFPTSHIVRFRNDCTVFQSVFVKSEKIIMGELSISRHSGA
jgi:hypothetical protein